MEVGVLPNQHITSNVTIRNLRCNLTHFSLRVVNEWNLSIPFVKLTIHYTYLTRHNRTESDVAVLNTGKNGTATMPNALLNANYTIRARRYDRVFNETRLTGLAEILRDGRANLTIICPTYSMLVHVVDSKGRPIRGAGVKVYDWGSWMLVGADETDEAGAVTLNCPFGRYWVKAYLYDETLGVRVLLNETEVELFEPRTYILIRCGIVNLQPHLRVVDCLGRGVSGVQVRVERRVGDEWVEVAVETTDEQGIIPLPHIGGEYRVSAYVGERLCETRTLTVMGDATITIRLQGYLLLGGQLVEVTYLTTGGVTVFLAAVLALILWGKPLIRRVFRRD